MNSKLSRWCDGLIEVGWLAAVITAPLFFNIHSDRVFEPDKLTLLRSIALIMASAWLVKFVDQQGWQQFNRLRWQQDESIWRLPFTLIVALLALVYILSSLFSVTRSVSWAGSYQRLQGTYTTLSYIIIFTLTIATMRSRVQVRRVITAVIITSIPVSFYGVLQHFNLDPLPWAGNVEERVAGHMGNAIFIAAYLIMAVPLTLARIIASFTNILSDEELATADVVRSAIYIFTLAIQLITIYWSGSRGPWIGLGAGLFAFMLIVLVALRNASPDKERFRLGEAGRALALIVAVGVIAYVAIFYLLKAITSTGRLPSLAGPMSSFVAFGASISLIVIAIFIMIAAQRGWRWLWASWILLSFFLAAWLGVFNLPSELTASLEESPVVGGVVTALDEWRDLPRIGRLGRILESDSGTGKVRLLIWEGVLELIRPHEPLQFPDGRRDTFNFLRPLIGYGPESMYVAYNRFYPPELATLEARNASPDRSHNETFDALVITGLSGFLVWQALYLAVFYYGFRWLGVLRSRFDRNLLIGLWIGTGLVSAIGFGLWLGVEFIGVALPFGCIIGLSLYLIYYALFAEPPDEEAQPFAADRLLVVALVTAVLAHYAEIHFGIAIAATRVHFFVYVALLFMVTYFLPRLQTQPAPATEARVRPKKRRRRRAARSSAPAVLSSGWGPVLLYTLMLGLIVGILGFSFTTYSPPPDREFPDPATYNPATDTSLLLSATEVFSQSLFVNPKRDFAQMPFIYMMIILTWGLGVFVSASEMVKDGELKFTAVAITSKQSEKKAVAIGFLLFGGLSIAYRLLITAPGEIGATSALLGRTIIWVWIALCLWTGVRLLIGLSTSDHLFAGSVAMTGLVFALPVMIAGGVAYGLVLAAVCLVFLYLLWHKSWSESLLPIGVMALVSLSIGFVYMFYHANLVRFSIMFRYFVPLRTPDQLQEFLLAEAAQGARFLAYFYIFVVVLLIAAAFVLAANKKPRPRHSGSATAYVTLLVLIIAGIVGVYTTNLRIIQADMIYKRGRAYDNDAASTRNVQNWDNAITIYQDAIRRAPREDFYYLFLGRAFLERSTLTEQEAEQTILLNTARERLERAQDINPLNTDHTANLARLHTRWAELTNDEVHIAAAEKHYIDALALSPQNSIIRNEYANLILRLQQDCSRALATYNDSVAIDPYFGDTYFAMSEAYFFCARDEPETVQQEMYNHVVEALDTGLALVKNNARAWLRAGQLYNELGEYDRALVAFEQLRQNDPQERVIPAWNVDFLLADVYRDLGDLETAESLALQALSAAPPDANGQIQQFLDELNQSG